MKGDLIMNATQKAVHLFGNGLNCSQAILTAFGEPYGLDPENAKKLGRPWGGGLGRLGQICGAVTGAVALLGYTQSGAQDEAEARDAIYASVQELVGRFEECNGTSVCRELLGADFQTEEGQRKIKEEMLVKKLCPKFVEDVGTILEKLLKD
jgi:C_GCAxxG_C_C family probable redox protein